MEVARKAGAAVVAAGAVIDRSGGTSDLGVPFHALVTLTLATYPPESCPLCAAGAPIMKPGSR
jgi:orotate phosphoribosyltransferase